jgi:hypothetical protein
LEKAADDKFLNFTCTALVGAYMQTCAIDFVATSGVAELSAALIRLADMLDE